MRFILYARKSTDREDMQIQSIPDQIKTLKNLARERGYTIVESIQESASAKEPGRPLFNAMLERIKNGEADGVLCWQINRLCRNPVDAGALQWMLQKGQIKLIQTMEKSYLPEDNVLIFSVETGVANQYIIDLKKSVNRGMNSKIEKGWMPGKTPIGYLNDRDSRTIISDPVRFPIVRKMWDTMLMGCYSVPQILDMATDDWGLEQKKTKNRVGRPLTEGAAYKIFRNIFYTGFFTFSGQRYEGKHEPMVTLEQFQKVQEILDGKDVNVVPISHEHAYTGMIRCGECGYHITCDTKVKIIKTTGLSKTYHYYKCSGKGPCCSQSSKSIPLPILEKQIDDILSSVQIKPDFLDWGLKIVREKAQKESGSMYIRLDALDDKIKRLRSKRDNLLGCLLENLISRSEYAENKKNIEADLLQAETQRQVLGNSATSWVGRIENAFDFISNARTSFTTADKRTKREIFRSLGQNFLIKDQKLSLELHSWMTPIIQNTNIVCVGDNRSEPSKNLSGTAFPQPGEAISILWGPHGESNSDLLDENQLS